MPATNCPVSAVISSDATFKASLPLAVITTVQPHRANSLAIAFPMPLLPPVTSAVLP